jgi:aminoglycoside 6'-N-acetyltransferase
METDKAAGPEVALLPFEPERDLPRLEEWLARPHVARWFGDPEGHLAFARDLPEGGDHALIACDDEPAGYLRWQEVSREVLDGVGLTEIPAGAVDVDLFLDHLRRSRTLLVRERPG